MSKTPTAIRIACHNTFRNFSLIWQEGSPHRAASLILK